MLRASVRRFGLAFKSRKSDTARVTEPYRNQSSVKCLATVPDWSLDHRQVRIPNLMDYNSRTVKCNLGLGFGLGLGLLNV
jgi:hypothetical protein